MSHELPETPLQADRLLQTLTRHGVDFVVIGGVAELVHGSAYPTYDLDIAYSRDRANLERMTAALKELDVTLRGAPADLPFQLDVQTLDNGANFTFDTPYGSFDILAHADGMPGYDVLRREARVDEIEGIEVRIAAIDHLLSMKRAANRTKDKLMVEELISLAEQQPAEAGDSE